MTRMEKVITAGIGIIVLALMILVGSYVNKGEPKSASEFTVSATEFVAFSSTVYDYLEPIAWVDYNGKPGGDWQGIMDDYWAHQECKKRKCCEKK